MNTYRWLFTQCPEKNFSRNKKWSFEEMLKFILTMEGKSIKDELLEYFEFDISTPTNSSFNQRRKQILPEAFEFLFHEFTDIYEKTWKTYKGYRLIACDGTDLCIAHNPEDKTTYFQSLPDSKGFNLLHLNAFYDLSSRVYVDALIQPGREQNEDRAMCDLIDRYHGQTAIFIADRNYENYNIFAHVEEKGMYYLIRVKDICSTGMLRSFSLPNTQEFDIYKTITLTRKQTNEVKANKEKYKFLPINSIFDYLDTNIFYELKMRIVRFPIGEDSYECVITNLSQEEFGLQEIKKLYSMRWGVETSFRELKYAIGLVSFHSKKVAYILQEIWARMTLYNFCEIISMSIALKKCKQCKHTYQLNYTRAIHICRYFLSVKKGKAPPDIEYLIGHELLPVRAGRSDHRKVRTQPAISFLYRIA